MVASECGQDVAESVLDVLGEVQEESAVYAVPRA
jgi:hypothetical protein